MPVPFGPSHFECIIPVDLIVIGRDCLANTFVSNDLFLCRLFC